MVEMVIGKSDPGGFARQPECIPLPLEGKDSKGILKFFVSYNVTKNGSYTYGIRVLPNHPYLASKQETNLVYWG